jgi:hypothetical protein
MSGRCRGFGTICLKVTSRHNTVGLSDSATSNLLMQPGTAEMVKKVRFQFFLTELRKPEYLAS